jgi:hypothetical protein
MLRLVSPLLAMALLCCQGFAAAQDVAIPMDTKITLQRTACFVECAAYTVSIDASGRVMFEGGKNLRVPGRHFYGIPLSQVARILSTVERIGFFGLKDQYRENITDQRTTFVTVTRRGQTKRIEDYFGAPSTLHQLEREIDEVTRTKQWIFFDALSLRQLAAKGWRPRREEAAEFLQRAVAEDDVSLIKGFLDLGVSAKSVESNPLYVVRSGAAARLLLEAGANPNGSEASESTPLRQAGSKPPEVAQELLNAGAVPDVATGRDRRTALWQASCEGNAEVVRLLLGAGADPTVRAGLPRKTAVECARVQQEMYEHVRLTTPFLGSLASGFERDFDGVVTLLEQAIAERLVR